MKRTILIFSALALISISVLAYASSCTRNELRSPDNYQHTESSVKEDAVLNINTAESPDSNSSVIIYYYYGGELLRTDTVDYASAPEKYQPEREGMRFVGWIDASGNSVSPETISATENAEYRAKMLPIFGTHNTYLFEDDNKLIYPDDDLSKNDFQKALNALIPDSSSASELNIWDSDETVTLSELWQILSEFFTEDELAGISQNDSSITRRDFAHLINGLLKRTDENVSLNEYSLRTVDSRCDDYDIFEASIVHECSEDGTCWDNLSLDVDWPEYEDYLDMIYIEPTELGTVESEYAQHTINLMTYLPYGYDPEKKYNVLVYLNGGDGSPEMILGEGGSYEHRNNALGTKFSTKNYLDFLIQYGYCDPVIVVSTNSSNVQSQVEWRYTELLLHTVQNYSTYAETPDIEGIVAARDHFALVGESNGAMSVCVSIQTLPDMFAYYGLFSGYYKLGPTMDALSQKGTIQWIITNSGGWRDDNQTGMTNVTAELSKLDNVLNVEYVRIEQYGHDSATFDGALREFLMKFVPNTRKIIHAEE